MRELKGLKPLKINDDIAHIASINLYEATEKGTGSAEFTENALTQQLDENNVSYTSTSQNVGYDFDDVPTLIHSWMNSDIHRSRMLNNKYDEMGGEVMKDYYSLIFLESKIRKGENMITEETLSILDEIENLSDMIVQSDVYQTYQYKR